MCVAVRICDLNILASRDLANDCNNFKISAAATDMLKSGDSSDADILVSVHLVLFTIVTPFKHKPR